MSKVVAHWLCYEDWELISEGDRGCCHVTTVEAVKILEEGGALEVVETCLCGPCFDYSGMGSGPSPRATNKDVYELRKELGV